MISSLQRIRQSIVRVARGKGRIANLTDSALFGVKRLSAVLPDRAFVQAYYRLHTGRKLQLGNPQTYNEKLQWLKLYYRPTEMTRLVDKYAVRDYVASRVGEDALIPIHGVFDTTDEIDLDALPDSFVLKPTHGSGWVIICRDKTTFDWDAAKAKLDIWLRRNYYYHAREWAYRDVPPRVLCEKLLTNEDGNVPPDYRLFCFGGQPRFIQVELGRFSDHRRNLFDTSWNSLDVEVLYPRAQEPIPRPVALEEMVRMASALSEPFPFCRVDFYAVESQVYFGELTFFPGNGVNPIRPSEYDRIWGEWIRLPDRSGAVHG